MQLCPVCGVCAPRQLILTSAAWHQKHASRGIELVLFLMPDAWYWPIMARVGEATLVSCRNIKTRYLNEDINLKLIQLQTVLLLLAFSSLLNITASTPAAKQHQIIVLIGGLAVWSHFDDLSLHVEALPYMEQCVLNCCVHVLLVSEYRHW